MFLSVGPHTPAGPFPASNPSSLVQARKARANARQSTKSRQTIYGGAIIAKTSAPKSARDQILIPSNHPATISEPKNNASVASAQSGKLSIAIPSPC